MSSRWRSYSCSLTATPVHVRRVAEIVRRALPGVSITVSHQISQEWREYERTNTVVINAYIQPIMERYLKNFVSGVRGRAGLRETC